MTDALAFVLIVALCFRHEISWIYDGKPHTLILHPKQKDRQSIAINSKPRGAEGGL